MPVDLRANAGNDEGRLAEITWHNEKRAIRDLIPYEVNPRQITNKQAKDLKASLAKFGIADPLIINTDNMIIGGHQRKKILETLLGYEPDYQIDVRVPDRELSIDEARELNVRLNKNVADWDFDILANNFELDDLLDWGFDKGELDLNLWADEAPEDVEPQIDKAEELRVKWGVESGQLWQLGEHRLVCGDCTDKAVVERVMGGERASLLFTSPPYWVGMDYETQKSEQEIDDFIHACSRTFTEFVSVDNGRIVINTGTAAIHRIEKKRKVEVLPLIFKWQMELRQSGWLARHYRIWAKSGGFAGGVVSPKVDAVDQHWETITTFSAETEEQQYVGTYRCPAGLQRGQEKIGEKWAQQGIWTDIQGDKSANGTHIAAFPLELPERNIRLYSKDCETVFEPFSGSGTTLIACERLGRKCRAVEISPAYCAVTLDRFYRMTNITPVLLES